MTLQNSPTFLQGQSDADSDTVPFGVPAFSKVGLPDELLSNYGERHTARALDRLADDIDAAPEQDWHPSGAEMEAERRHVNAIIDEIARQVPDDCMIRVSTDTGYCRFSSGRREDTRQWTCTIMLPARLGSSMFTAVYHADPESAAREALAKFHADPRADVALREMAAAEIEQMAESDYGGKAA